MRGTRGSTRSRLRTAPWDRNELWRRAQAVPSLDLRFAEDKSLVDAISGQNLITFTRASDGTFVGSDGVLRTAVTNLNTNSEAFDTYTTAAGSVSANAGIAPNGTLTADEITSTGAGIFKSISGTVASITITASVYAKYISGGNNFLFGFDANPASGRVVFNLQTGTLGAADANVVSRSITPVGGGWYRCSVTTVATSASTVVVFYNGTPGAKWLLWGAQLEQSTTAGEYVPTGATINSAPRFDHNPLTGESLGLLVEEQRSNLCLQSEAFGTSPWSASNVTVSANTETSPAATLTADTLAATNANGTVRQPVTTTAVAMTFSVYLKRKTGTGNIDISADGTTWVTQTINSSTWTRCIVTQTAVAGTSNPGVRIVASGDEVYAWGGQYE